MKTLKILLCALTLSVIPAASGMTGKTDLYGAIGRGSPLNPGALITVDQNTGTGAFVGHPDSLLGLTGLVSTSPARSTALPSVARSVQAALANSSA